MRHQSVAMPFAPVATQCGLPKSPGTAPRSWRSNIGVRAKDRFHSLIPSPAGQNRGSRSCTFSRVLRACRELPRRPAAEQRDELAPLHVLPSEDHTLSHHCRDCRVVHHSKMGRPSAHEMGPTCPLDCTTALPQKAEVHPRSCYVARVPGTGYAPRFPDHARTSKLIDLARCFMPLRRSMDREGALNSSEVPRRPHHEHPWVTCGKGLTQMSNWITEQRSKADAPSATNVLAR